MQEQRGDTRLPKVTHMPSKRNIEKRLDNLEQEDVEDMSIAELLSADPNAAGKRLRPETQRKLEEILNAE
ncbi:hypothetical protein [Haladaptatus salinisoli]|uniref:hypothetical protein n=1 Tax=Haladaptatus salinisoli TaxID=2884876 RepID=UPI001D0BA31C|nr:hypothetical protein [Haladaptatus salinisoli]